VPAFQRVSSDELQPGDEVGVYALVEFLGEGAAGVVFRARRAGDGREVALKLLKQELAQDKLFRQRFARESHLAAQVRHPHLVPVLDSGEAAGRYYLASEYVAGGSLAERLSDQEPLGLDEIVRSACELASALDALHMLGVIHRDVKPSNVMLGPEGAVALTDFGLARARASTALTRPGQLLGTIGYAAPELILGQAASPAVDVYALGCTIYECVAGEPPFSDRSFFQVGLAHLQETPANPAAGRSDIPSEFGAAVCQALEKEPQRRPGSAGAYATALVAAAGRGG
jgi:serine/threonine protein kinase